MVVFENKFEELVNKLINENNELKKENFKNINQNKLQYANLKNETPQPPDVIDYYTLVNFYNSILPIFDYVEDTLASQKENVYELGRTLVRGLKIGTEDICRLISAYDEDFHEVKQRKQECLSETCECLSETSSGITFGEIHDFVTSKSGQNTGGKPKTNKIKKTKSRRNKNKKTNKRKKTKLRSIKKKMRIRTRRR